MAPPLADVSVVLITRNRRDSLLRTLAHLRELPERPEIVVVDNGSSDGSAAAVEQLAREDGRLRLVRLSRNAGASGRNAGVAVATGELIAFCDDDSWWEPGSLTRAARLLARHPDVGVLVAQVRLAGDRRPDRASRKMAAARLGTQPGDPGPRVLSFPAFAAVVRREVFDAVGGFSRLLFFGGEERLFALDVAATGRRLCYVEAMTAWHAAAGGSVTPRRWALQQRNDLLVDWMRRPLRRAAAGTLRLARRALTDRHAAVALAGVARRLPAALAARRPVDPAIDRALRLEDRPLSDSLGSRTG